MQENRTRQGENRQYCTNAYVVKCTSPNNTKKHVQKLRKIAKNRAFLHRLLTQSGVLKQLHQSHTDHTARKEKTQAQQAT